MSDRLSDNEIRYTSSEYSVHLHEDAEWWFVDTVDDRGQLRENVARFSTFELAEVFLVWHWASTARNVLRLTSVGRELYLRGIAPNVEAIALAEGIYELRSAEGRAVLLEPEATIFSHLMSKSINEIETIGKAGVDSWGSSDPHSTNPSKED
ncbi:hypothetical protein C6A86_008640 [Mycobacterium sp. ITM-2016-00316]|uniref:hypothetical protein n=1 Tax=Mycobacterium sp. ITM-2016-00316 TaxID=2099695 RepID=UPI0011597B24|nr:hypothetical protein [Mycobacterium sp. ITM-2016-00316]WNG83705.1 hypothetical protein C6A86_008640 [Mycobacterium sp. ITM-2016-00316]